MAITERFQFWQAECEFNLSLLLNEVPQGDITEARGFKPGPPGTYTTYNFSFWEKKVPRKIINI